MPRVRKAERLRRERISRSLRAYYREQRRLQEARAEGARHYWRRVKQAAGRHRLTLQQARQTIRLADELGIPVTEAVRLLFPPPPPPPPRPPVWEGEEYAFGLMETVPDMPDRFRGKDPIAVEFRFDIFFDRERMQPPEQQFASGEFPGSDDEGRWWGDYFSELKAVYDVEWAKAVRRWLHLTSDDVVAVVLRLDAD